MGKKLGQKHMAADVLKDIRRLSYETHISRATVKTWHVGRVVGEATDYALRAASAKLGITIPAAREQAQGGSASR